MGNREVILQHNPLNSIRNTSYANLDKFLPVTTCRTRSVSTFAPEPRGPSDALGALKCDWSIGLLLWSVFAGVSKLILVHGAWQNGCKNCYKGAPLMDLSKVFIHTSCHLAIVHSQFVLIEEALLYQGFTGTAHLHLASIAQGHHCIQQMCPHLSWMLLIWLAVCKSVQHGTISLLCSQIHGQSLCLPQEVLGECWKPSCV